MEVEAQARVARGIDLWANGTLSRNRFLKFQEFLGAAAGSDVNRDGNPIAGFPDVLMNGGVRLAARRLTADVTFRYRGRQYVDNSGQDAEEEE